ncbi:hypothetical protein [Methylomonas sp. HYX-M1]|uniref:hypothetical protein n=1 Tax=Methylomonas sp. HYX-M1 TaxID=3139307 RepID=UPI00345C5022
MGAFYVISISYCRLGGFEKPAWFWQGSTLEAKQAKSKVKALALKQEAANSENAYTVRVLCDEYLAGHVCRHRAPKGSAEITRPKLTVAY